MAWNFLRFSTLDLYAWLMLNEVLYAPWDEEVSSRILCRSCLHARVDPILDIVQCLSLICRVAGYEAPFLSFKLHLPLHSYGDGCGVMQVQLQFFQSCSWDFVFCCWASFSDQSSCVRNGQSSWFFLATEVFSRRVEIGSLPSFAFWKTYLRIRSTLVLFDETLPRPVRFYFLWTKDSSYLINKWLLVAPWFL